MTSATKTPSPAESTATLKTCKHCRQPIEPVPDPWNRWHAWHHPRLSDNSDGQFIYECEEDCGVEAEPLKVFCELIDRVGRRIEAKEVDLLWSGFGSATNNPFPGSELVVAFLASDGDLLVTYRQRAAQ
jgi:hypothetical protein